MIPAADCAFLAALCGSRAGLRLDSDKAYLIESRLGPVARREGYATPEVLIDVLRQGGDERLSWAAVEAMALPEGEFFRDRDVFQRLVDEVIPGLIRQRAGRPVRIWSAACGTGQEIYSLAMLLADRPELAKSCELYASDLSERSLEKAQSGLYSQFEVQRGLPSRLLVRHFEKRGESFALSPRIRQMIRWRRVNLMDDLSRLGPFDLVLCRNMLSQLAPPALGPVRAHLRTTLAPGGRLLLGMKEEGQGDLEPVASEMGLYAA
ncbi:MAG: protein-glutamate O-methyltransferase CheR [Phenylobacterium sp.]|nr:protein-glutamate O-methyltransferase CheR [Phenylobacterium sp.]